MNTVYSYWALQHLPLGGEIKEPEKKHSAGIFLSVLGIAALYLLMQSKHSGRGAVARGAGFESASLFVERLYGTAPRKG